MKKTFFEFFFRKFFFFEKKIRKKKNFRNFFRKFSIFWTLATIPRVILGLLTRGRNDAWTPGQAL